MGVGSYPVTRLMMCHLLVSGDMIDGVKLAGQYKEDGPFSPTAGPRDGGVGKFSRIIAVHSSPVRRQLSDSTGVLWSWQRGS